MAEGQTGIKTYEQNGDNAEESDSGLGSTALVDEQEEILKANAMDIESARKKNMPEPMVDRLVLSESRIAGMAEGLTQLIALEDPIGEIISLRSSKWS